MKRIGLKRNQRTLPWSGMSSERVGYPYRGLRWAVRWKRVLRALRHPSQAPIGVAGPIATPEALSLLQPCRSVVPRTWSLARLAPALFEERPDLASYFLVLAAGLPIENRAPGRPFLGRGWWISSTCANVPGSWRVSRGPRLSPGEASGHSAFIACKKKFKSMILSASILRLAL
jgi:hypothetical protein